MSVEHVIAVALPLDEDRRLLVEDIRSAGARAEKGLAGDRADIARFEALSTQLEQWAFSHRDEPGAVWMELPADVDPPGMVAGGGTDLAFLPADRRARVREILGEGGVLATVRLPLEAGTATRRDRPAIAPPDPAEPWKSATGARGARAVKERFEAQIEACLDGSGGSLSPSDIQNVVLTTTLRAYVTGEGPRVDVPIEYRDGSRSRHPFPFRALTLAERLGKEPNELALALLSIRHTEMDAVVDGAFLRNAEISQPRPAAATDDLVYEISREQLLALTDDGRSRIHLRIYQTGLDTAIMGFYRAVVAHLLDHPRSLAVTPMFYEGGRPPARRGGKAPRRHTGQPIKTARFQEGAVWAT